MSASKFFFLNSGELSAAVSNRSDMLQTLMDVSDGSPFVENIAL